MILESVKLSNIRSYISEEVKFPSGSVLLSGDIGCGKSTVLLAIEFALFGIGRGILSGESLLRNGKKEGYVELKFSLNKKNIMIKRTLKRGKLGVAQSAGFILIDGSKEEGTAVELKAKILDLLGYPKEMLTKKSLIYRYTVYTPQEDMKRIIFDDSDERLNTLRKIFGVDKYKRVKENVELYLRQLREKQNILSEKVADLDVKVEEKKVKEKEASGLSSEIRKVEPSLKALSSDLESKKKTLQEFESKVKDLAEVKKDIDVCEVSLREKVGQRVRNNEQIMKFEQDLKELSKRIDSIKIPSVPVDEVQLEKAIKKKEERFSKLVEQGSSAKERLNSVVSNLESLEREVSSKISLCKDLPLLNARLNELQDVLSSKKDLVKDIEVNENDFSSLSLDVREVEIKVEASSSLKSKIFKLDSCPTCLQPVTLGHKKVICEQEDKKIGGLTSSLKNLSVRKAKSGAMLKDLKGKLDDFLKKEKELERLSSDIKNVESISQEVISKRKQIAEFRKEQDKLKTELVNEDVIIELRLELENQKETLKKVVSAKSLQKEKNHLLESFNEKSGMLDKLKESQLDLKKCVGEINVRKLEMQARLDSFKSLESDFEKEKVSFEDLRHKEKELEIKRATLLSGLESVSKLVGSLDEEINVRLKFKDDVDYINKLRQWLSDHFVRLTGLIERHVMVNVHREFDELFRGWFGMIIEDDNLSIRLDDSFKPVVLQNGYDTDLGNLSGGEKTSAALAYRLSLNKVVNDLVEGVKTKDLIILDEPTDGFSSEQLDKVRLVLDELNIKQVIMVSHEAKIESFVDSVVRIVKNEHVSKVVS